MTESKDNFKDQESDEEHKSPRFRPRVAHGPKKFYDRAEGT
jgi:hypothetical protein